ncbi:MAG: hypothetical protein A2Y17_12100 [Clostridiales bacterium GWF2_38_85]|nr:MAG: hypothetical protein A2Y17_12100 [Clostridiales bacterium GWF2_38_85]
MKANIIESYIEKVYGYAVNRTYSREEADELAQEILFTAVRELPKLKDDSKFEPWFWGVAGNVTKTFQRYMGKQRAMYSYDTLEVIPYEDEYGDENEELYDSLKTKIAMLSAIYRDIVILYYYDNLSTKQISEKLNISEGTITWRLSEARKKLKKECTEMNETALRPVNLQIRINGDGNYKDPISPFPYVYINDALSQNILYYCYEMPKTVEELAKLCGVPAYYIEDCLKNLIYREAMSETSKGKYRTQFIIYSDKVNEYNEKAKCVFTPVIESFVSSIKALNNDINDLGIYTARKPNEELMYLYGIMALEYLSEKYNPVRWIERPVRYDGCRWSYYAHLMTGNKYPVRGLGREESSNRGSRGSYKHISYHFGGFAYRRMMFDAELLFSGLDLFIHQILGLEEESAEKPYIFAVSGNRALLSRIDTEYHNPYYTRRVDEIMKVNHDTLGNIIEFSNETWNQKKFFDDEFPYIEISNIKLKENSYSLSMISKNAAPSRAKMIVRNGDILVSTTRPHRGAIATATCDKNGIQIASTGFCILRKLKRKDVSREYLQWILLNDYILQQMLQRSSGGNYPEIVPDELKKVIIPIPSEKIQAQICHEANRRKQYADELRQKAEQEWATAKAQFEKELLKG